MVTTNGYQSKSPSGVREVWGDIGIFQESDTNRMGTILGQERWVGDRLFRLAKAGEALVAGKLCEGPASVANHLNANESVPIVNAAAAAGAFQVTVKIGATLVSVDQYAEGYLIICDATAEGQTMKIKAHPAADSGATDLVLTLYDPVFTALTTASECSLVLNCYDGTRVHDSPPTTQLTGIPLIDVTSAYYYWSLRRGVVSCLIDGAITAGVGVISGTSDGSVATVASGSTLPTVGTALHTGTTTQYDAIYLHLE